MHACKHRVCRHSIQIHTRTHAYTHTHIYTKKILSFVERIFDSLASWGNTKGSERSGGTEKARFHGVDWFFYRSIDRFELSSTVSSYEPSLKFLLYPSRMENPKPLTQFLENSFGRSFLSFSFFFFFFHDFVPCIASCFRLLFPFPVILDDDRDGSWALENAFERVGRNEGNTHKTRTREYIHNILIRGEKRKKEEGEKNGGSEGVRCR